MIPYFELPTPEIAGIQFPWFMLLIVVGIAAGTEYARARAIREDLSVKITVDCTLFMVVFAFLVSHWVAILFYHPDKLAEDWKNLLPWYNFSISSMGGYLGAGVAIPLFLKVWKKAPAWAYTDCLAFGVTLGFFFGRLGCFTAHDHIGSKTDFFLAVQFPDRFKDVSGYALGTRHDLGLYEALVLAFIFGLFLFLDRRKQWFHGFFSGLLLVLYSPARLFLDSLRGQDLSRSDLRWQPGDLVRVGSEWVSNGGNSALDLLNSLQTTRAHEDLWVGLTFAQYGAIFLFVLGGWILWSRHDKGRQDTSQELARDGAAPSTPAEEPAAECESSEPGEPDSGTEGQGSSEGSEGE